MVETRRNSSASKSFPASSSSPELSSHLHSLPSDLRSRSMLLLNLYVRSEFRCGPSHVRVSDSSKESATVMGKKQALISLSDKKDLATFGKGLQELGLCTQTYTVVSLLEEMWSIIWKLLMSMALDGIENIDIGGPTMIRAAAKNHKDVLIVVDSEDY
ncbi:hypothetical protein YC2023_027538 [Brassica napus]